VVVRPAATGRRRRSTGVAGGPFAALALPATGKPRTAAGWAART